MSERSAAMDDATMQFGLLMESAQAHQKLAETHLEKLRAHTQDLDGVVRGEIRRTLISELEMLTSETKRTSDAFQMMRRGLTWRGGVWSLLTATLCTAIPAVTLHLLLPSESEIAALRVRRDHLAAEIDSLEKRGGRISWRRCGEGARLCIRVDRKSPSYGENADYLVVAGY